MRWVAVRQSGIGATRNLDRGYTSRGGVNLNLEQQILGDLRRAILLELKLANCVAWASCGAHLKQLQRTKSSCVLKTIISVWCCIGRAATTPR